MQLTSRECLHGASRLEDVEVSQRQAQERERPRVQEIAPAQPIAEMNALFRVEPQHPGSLPALEVMAVLDLLPSLRATGPSVNVATVTL